MLTMAGHKMALRFSQMSPIANLRQPAMDSIKE
jgi:hypothetical protein